MIPAHFEFAIREAVKLLAASSRNFKSRQLANDHAAIIAAQLAVDTYEGEGDY